MPLNIKPSSGSGSVTISATTGTTTNDTLTLPAKTGNIITSADSGTVTQTMLGTNVAGNGPAFIVYSTAAQSLTSGVVTKLTFNTVEYDTNNNFASNRFTPTIAGFYIVTSAATITSASQTYAYALIYKNGAQISLGSFGAPYGASTTASNVSTIIYMNGSSDYLELWAQADGTSPTTNATYYTRFTGAIVRGA